MDEYLAARQVAERYIDYQPRTSTEVRRRLVKSGFDASAVERVLSDLESAGLLNDARFSAEWVESRARSKRYGASRLASELRAKGVSKEETESALQQLDAESEFQNALSLARKRLGSTADDRRRTTDDAWGDREMGHSGESVSRQPAAVDSRGPTPDERRRLAAYLQRRGYSWEIIQQVFAELFQNSG